LGPHRAKTRSLSRAVHSQISELHALGAARRTLGQKDTPWNEEKTRKMVSWMDEVSYLSLSTNPSPPQCIASSVTLTCGVSTQDGDGIVTSEEFVEYFSNSMKVPAATSPPPRWRPPVVDTYISGAHHLPPQPTPLSESPSPCLPACLPA